jgi:putative glutamine amidotransferase
MAPPRPWVGINTDYLTATKQAPAYARLNPGYFDVIAASGGLPVILPPFGKEPLLTEFLDRIDGIVLTGGLDLDPRRWGLPPHPSTQPMAARRDESDRLLVQLVIDRKLPVLAIGAGMQQINVACGGSLFLHLPEDQPRAMPHRDTSDPAHRHAVLIEPNTRMEEIYGAGEVRVNSWHHQAVRLVADGFRVGARSPDGVIEAIESTDPDWFCVGVQWHPEAETASALDMQLLEAFVQACLKQGQDLKMAA